MKKRCLTCGEEFVTYPSNIARGGGKYCSWACRRGNCRAINIDFFKAWSPEMAWVLGLYFADGCVHKGKGWNISLVSCDFSLLDKVRGHMQSAHAITSNRSWYQFQIGRTEIAQDLIELGLLPRKSLVMCFPDVPDMLLPHFIRGYMDGDGCLMYKGPYLHTVFTCASTSFLDVLENIINLPCQRYRATDSVVTQHLRYADRASHILLDWLYRDATPRTCLQRKHEIYTAHCQVCPTETLYRLIGDRILGLGHKFHTPAFLRFLDLAQQGWDVHRPTAMATALGVCCATAHNYRKRAIQWGLL